jgi:small subunit ribosomal protein S18
MPPPPRKRTPGRYRRTRRKVCLFCVEKATAVDYKASGKLRKFVTERGKIVPRRTSGTCASHQRLLTTAIKRARHMALLHYISE